MRYCLGRILEENGKRELVEVKDNIGFVTDYACQKYIDENGLKGWVPIEYDFHRRKPLTFFLNLTGSLV